MAAQPSYLTPVQRITEESLAPRRLLDESMRVEQATARNPLIESGLQLAVSAVPETIPAPPSNPLIRPPVPLSVMGTDQRIAWEQLEDEEREKQDAVESRKLEAEIRRQQLDHRAEQVRQNQELATHMPKLREALNTSPEAYLDLKADLASRYAIGMGSPESDKIFSEFEKIYTKREDTEAGIKKARIAREEANRLKREDILLKDAGQYGGEVAREVAARLADPLKGADDASALLAQVQEKSVVQSLRDARLNDEQIAQYGTGKDFNYQAARQAVKSRASATAERNKIGNEVLAMEKMRKTLTDVGEDWDETHQQIYDDKLAQWRELTPQVGDNRAGVQGMSPGAMQVAQQQAFNYATTPAQSAAVTTPSAVPVPAADPGWRRTTPLPGSRAIGAAVQPAFNWIFGQPAQSTQAATRAEPSPTPAPPPPLNPAYPEQWRGGKRYVQVNGQWYLSKVQ